MAVASRYLSILYFSLTTYSVKPLFIKTISNQVRSRFYEQGV